MRNAISGLTVVSLLLAGCGGGGGSGGSTGGTVTLPTPAPAPAPAPAPTACSLTQRMEWARTTLQEWYLFPNDMAGNVNPAAHGNIHDYVDALVAPARAQGKDRYFTYVTSIAEEEAFYASGSSAGFGVRLVYDVGQRRLFVAEAFENAPGLAAGIDRGTEIIAIGTSSSNLRNVSDIMAAEGPDGVTAALGPGDAGVTRVLSVRDLTVPSAPLRTVTVAKAEFDLLPVSPRYGVRILERDGRRVGYLNLRTFIASAEQPLRQAFQTFRDAGITEILVDVRYNGGGLLSVANLFGDLVGRDRSASEAWSRTMFRPEKSNNDSTYYFRPAAQSVAPTRLVFLTSGGSASASEMIINSALPYLGNNVVIVGTDTYGKPVGQIAIDRAACDDRIRVVAFATANAQGQGDYYNGMASKVANACSAYDEVVLKLGEANEGLVAGAFSFLTGRGCTSLVTARGATASAERGGFGEARQILLQPDAPTPAQREVPGLF